MLEIRHKSAWLPRYAACDFRIVANPGTKQMIMSEAERPVCDEWGLYDPEQAGFEALVRRLLPEDDEVRRAQALSLPLSSAASTRWP